MNKFIIWITSHPDVVVSFNKNPILNSLCVKMQIRPKGLAISCAFDDLEYPWLGEDEDHFIWVLDDLYNKLNNEKEGNDENDKR